MSTESLLATAGLGALLVGQNAERPGGHAEFSSECRVQEPCTVGRHSSEGELWLHGGAHLSRNDHIQVGSERTSNLRGHGHAAAREVGDRWGMGWVLHALGVGLLAHPEVSQADAQSADAVLQESIATWRELGERRHLAFANVDLSGSAIWQGNLGFARAGLTRAS